MYSLYDKTLITIEVESITTKYTSEGQVVVAEYNFTVNPKIFYGLQEVFIREITQRLECLF
jgi:hypothetical protein